MNGAPRNQVITSWRKASLDFKTKLFASEPLSLFLEVQHFSFLFISFPFPSHHSYLSSKFFLFQLQEAWTGARLRPHRSVTSILFWQNWTHVSQFQGFEQTSPFTEHFSSHLPSLQHSFLSKNRCTQYLEKCKSATGYLQLYKASIIPLHPASDPT